MSPQEKPRVLVSVNQSLGSASARQSGALWRLTELRRQLDANLVRLPPGASVADHVEHSMDVLLVVVDGRGHLDGDDGPTALESGSVAWLPHASRRGLRAGPQGMAYLTVHQRRPGISIAAGAPQEGGEAPCALDRVCPHCGKMRAESGAPYCSWCGERVP